MCAEDAAAFVDHGGVDKSLFSQFSRISPLIYNELRMHCVNDKVPG